MKTLRVLDSSGDTSISFDDSTPEARAAARALFDARLAAGATAFKIRREHGRPDEKVTDFWALEEETVIVPRIVGG
ncbi:MAG TPA: hypothetical protein VFV71_08455 [Burkholderiales bacterium]|nr:hypothetical protein [Burkholderiales bacterium]